jgi:hypothetical protein
MEGKRAVGGNGTTGCRSVGVFGVFGVFGGS